MTYRYRHCNPAYLVGALAVSLACGSDANATTLRLFVTVGQIEGSFAAGSSVGAGNCLTGLRDCAIYGVGFANDSAGVGSGAGGHGSSTGTTTNGAPWGWAAAQFGGPGGNNSAWEVGGPKASFITLNGNTSGNSGYTGNVYHAPEFGTTPLKASTTLAFMLNYDVPPAYGLNDVIVLNILAIALDPATGAQLGPYLTGQLSVLGHVNYDGSITASAITPAPEPPARWLAFLFLVLIWLGQRLS